MPGTVVELRAAKIPLIGAVARHHWLVVRDGQREVRWEVWQRPDWGGESWGHLHRNLLPPEAGVGSGPSWVVTMWRGAAAETLAARLDSSPTAYPWCHRYYYWPGPNSNTYVQWVLGDRFALGRRAPGRWFVRFAHARE